MAVKDISASQFQAEVLEAKDFVLVDFWAPWCMPCQMMAPILDELASDKDLAAHLQIRKINTEEQENQPLAAMLQIMSIPNLKLFHNGKVVKEFVGFRAGGQFKAELMNVIIGN